MQREFSFFWRLFVFIVCFHGRTEKYPLFVLCSALFIFVCVCCCFCFVVRLFLIFSFVDLLTYFLFLFCDAFVTHKSIIIDRQKTTTHVALVVYLGCDATALKLKADIHFISILTHPSQSSLPSVPGKPCKRKGRQTIILMKHLYTPHDSDLCFAYISSVFSPPSNIYIYSSFSRLSI